MIGRLLDKAGARRRPRRPPVPAGRVVELARVRIERALVDRQRYRYVRPRVEPEGGGWRVVSPNCSRNIDRDGGEIAIAWLLPASGNLWLLHARDHRNDCWRLEAAGLSLDAALERLCADAARVFWP